MDIGAVQGIVQPLAASVPVAPVQHSAENREVVQAVKALNTTEMFGQENELVFQMDRQSRRMVVRVVNRKTQEVVSQVPAEYILRLREDLRSPAG
jgi:uncharacterized FlaG/YvyC family protein